MNVGKFGEKFYAITEYVMQLAYINLLWILFTLLGFGIFGLFPSTAALFAVTNEWVTEQKNRKCSARFGDTIVSTLLDKYARLCDDCHRGIFVVGFKTLYLLWWDIF